MERGKLGDLQPKVGPGQLLLPLLSERPRCFSCRVTAVMRPSSFLQSTDCAPASDGMARSSEIDDLALRRDRGFGFRCDTVQLFK